MKRILLAALGIIMFTSMFAQVDIVGDTTGEHYCGLPLALLLIILLIFLLIFLAFIGVCWLIIKWITKRKTPQWAEKE